MALNAEFLKGPKDLTPHLSSYAYLQARIAARPRQDARSKILFNTDFRYRRPSPHEGMWAALLGWLRHSHAGWKWLLVVLPVQSVSAWTNVHGISLALPILPAIALGCGLQAIALYAGIQLLNAGDEERERWRAPLAAILCVSVFCSFMGFTSFYSDYKTAQVLPLKKRDDLKVQTLSLSQKANEARLLANAKLSNRVEYARAIRARILSRQARGEYPDAAAAQGMLAEQDSMIQNAQEAQTAWGGFQFDATSALSATTTEEGFSVLQKAYAEMSGLMGKLTKSESAGFTMPNAPVPSLLAMDGAESTARIEQAFGSLFSLAGIFWLALAALLEAIPFWIAHARVNEDGEEGFQAVGSHPHGVMALGPQEAALAAEISRFNAMLRPVNLVGNGDLKEMEAQTARIDAVSEEMRRVHVEALRHMTIEKMADVRRKQLALIVREAEARGVPEPQVRKIVEENWLQFLQDIGVEEVRLERMREERREGALRPAEEGI